MLLYGVRVTFFSGLKIKGNLNEVRKYKVTKMCLEQSQGAQLTAASELLTLWRPAKQNDSTTRD